MGAQRLEALTTLRGVAAWWVVFYHFREPLMPYVPPWIDQVLANGFLAVDFFFVLSGFIIAAGYFQPLASGKGSDIKIFLWRRFARIYPLHFFVLFAYLSVPLAIWCCSAKGLPEERFSLSYFLQSLALVQNWGFGGRLDWNIPAWSISTEMGAYLLFALIAVTGVFSRITSIGACCVLGSSLLFLILIYTINGYNSVGDAVPQLGLWRCLSQFSIGCSLWFLARSGIGCRPTLGAIFLIAAVIILAAGWVYSVPNLFLVSPVASLLIVGISWFPQAPGVGLGWWPILHLGEISYSTYLAHDLVKQWVKFSFSEIQISTFVVYVIAVWVVSEFCFKFIEEPARKLLNKHSPDSQRSLS